MRLVILAIVALVAGGVVGGYLNFQSWNSNDAFVALAVNALAFLVAVVAALFWLRGRRSARYLAVGAGAFVIGAVIGAWVAPSADPPGSSSGSLRIDLTVPVAATSSGPAECRTSDDGAVSVSGGDGQTIGMDPILYSVSAPGADGNPGALSFLLAVGPATGTEARWDSNTEGDTHTLAVQGTAASGTMAFRDVAPSRDAPGVGGFGQSGVVAVSGTVTWTCEPPSRAPTPIEGSWFH